MSNFDFDLFCRDFHDVRRSKNHGISDVAKEIGKKPNILKKSVTPPFSRIQLETIVQLADYADLSLDKYRTGAFRANRDAERTPRLERGRTKNGYPILRPTRRRAAL